MSTLAIYGDAGQRVVDEGHPVADGPPQMPGVAGPWEDAARGACAERQVVLRTGIVLDRAAPAASIDASATSVKVGDLVSFGISHPCTTFDKWGLLMVVDEDYHVVDARKTFS